MNMPFRVVGVITLIMLLDGLWIGICMKSVGDSNDMEIFLLSALFSFKANPILLLSQDVTGDAECVLPIVLLYRFSDWCSITGYYFL